MRSLLFTFILALFIVFQFNPVLNAKNQDDSQKEGEQMDNVIDTKLVYLNNQFAFDFYNQHKSETGNIFFSPFSISTAVAMAFEGARGDTREQIKSVFYFPGNEYQHPPFGTLIRKFNAKGKKYELRTANAVWAQEDSKLLPYYVGTLQQLYQSTVEAVDFSNPEKACKTINGWVEDQTNDKIKNLIPVTAITPDTRMILTNAIYFLGTWMTQFDKNNTQEDDFRISRVNTAKVQMMRLYEENFRYGENSLFQVLELPYKGEELSMLIFLPKNDDLPGLEKWLSDENIKKARGNMTWEEVNIFLPRFKIETKYFMADDLKKMGMPAAFNPATADFSKMTGSKDYCIGEVIHQAFVEVNEEGTEAAAATAITMEVTAMPREKQPYEFRADHPFVFLIQERESGNILFMGRLSKP